MSKNKTNKLFLVRPRDKLKACKIYKRLLKAEKSYSGISDLAKNCDFSTSRILKIGFWFRLLQMTTSHMEKFSKQIYKMLLLLQLNLQLNYYLKTEYCVWRNNYYVNKLFENLSSNAEHQQICFVLVSIKKYENATVLNEYLSL